MAAGNICGRPTAWPFHFRPFYGLVEVQGMTDFASVVRSWETFYLLTGTAAATLIGLLFVAISIHIEVFTRRVASGLKHFAALTFNCYFYILLIAIFFLIPALSPLGLGIPLSLLGILGSANAAVQQSNARKTSPDRQGGRLASRFTGPMLSLAGLALMGVAIALKIGLSFYGVVIVIVLLLASASQNAWALLIQADDPMEPDKAGAE
jgi:hypothetical protein